ncbi:MAG: hypothetical protein LJE84_13960 [Gammaproteobacteria bacterium]|nr:hypothetical protein [Gammaproteobacteria bacterium]
MSDAPLLLAVVEQGGYPDFRPLYRELGYQAERARSVREARSFMKRQAPAVVVAEFNYQSDFRDRTSSLETLLASLQQHPGGRAVVLFDPHSAHQLDRLRERFHFTAVPFPVDEALLRAALARNADGAALAQPATGSSTEQ